MLLGHLRNYDGKPIYRPEPEMREAVRLNYDAWKRLFEEGIRAHGKKRFIEMLSNSVMPRLAARGIFIEARAMQLLLDEVQ